MKNMETIKLSSIKINPDNPRLIKDAAFKKLVQSVKRRPMFLEKRGIVVADGVILGGNQRYMAIREALRDESFRLSLGLSNGEIPALWLQDASQWTEEERREFVIVDNGSFGEWDMDILANQWSDLQLPDFGVNLPEHLFDTPKEAQEDDFDADAAAEAIKEPISKTGDVWLLGKHRVMCGDSTKKEDVERLMAGKLANMAFCDPPYGVSYADKNAMLNAVGRGNRIQTEIVNDHHTPKEMNLLWKDIFASLHGATTDRASYYITGPQGGELMIMMMMSIIHAGWQLKHMIIWVKNNHVLGRCDYHYKHEPILYGWKNGESHDFYGGTSQFSTWEIDKPLKSDLHPTMKPVELVARAINNSTKAGESIVDLCGGSGTSLIAAEQTGRIAYLMEIDQKYCDVIIARWEKLTGKKAVLEVVT